MGIFQHKKKSPINEAVERAEQVFDESFRKELRNHGRQYFEKIIDKNAVLFKQELDATITQVYTELKHHITTQLDEKFFEYTKSMKEAQDAALDSLTRSAEGLQEQYQRLNVTLQKNLATQEKLMDSVFDGNKTRVEQVQKAQDDALESLAQSVKALEEQQRQLGAALQENIAKQEEAMITAFEENMARVIEHYLLGALGDQYDLKTQLPSIIKQMETSKQAMVDDMKL